MLEGKRSQVEAARLLGMSDRHVRRILRRMEEQGDQGVVHRLRGRPGNRRLDSAFKVRVAPPATPLTLSVSLSRFP